MKRVRQSGTEPEMLLRKGLHRQGLRYVVGDRRLPGSPDIVFPRHRVAIFVHGCFWHGHACRQGRAPTSNQSYWVPKIQTNQTRDARKQSSLENLGWRVLTVWECEIRQAKRNGFEEFCTSFAALVRNTAPTGV